MIAEGETLVRGATKIALGLKISPLIVALTIIALCTSAPEMAVSLSAALGPTLWRGRRARKRRGEQRLQRDADPRRLRPRQTVVHVDDTRKTRLSPCRSLLLRRSSSRVRKTGASAFRRSSGSFSSNASSLMKSSRSDRRAATVQTRSRPNSRRRLKRKRARNIGSSPSATRLSRRGRARIRRRRRVDRADDRCIGLMLVAIGTSSQ